MDSTPGEARLRSLRAADDVGRHQPPRARQLEGSALMHNPRLLHLWIGRQMLIHPRLQLR